MFSRTTSTTQQVVSSTLFSNTSQLHPHFRKPSLLSPLQLKVSPTQLNQVFHSVHRYHSTLVTSQLRKSLQLKHQNSSSITKISSISSSITPFRPKLSTSTPISTLPQPYQSTKRHISYNYNKNIKDAQHPPSLPDKTPKYNASAEDSARFGFKKQQNFNLAQSQHTSGEVPKDSLYGRPGPLGNLGNISNRSLNNAQQQKYPSPKEFFLQDPTIPRWRKDFVRFQDFLSDSARPTATDADSIITKGFKFIVRAGLMPYRRIWKLSRFISLKLQSVGSWMLPTVLGFIAFAGISTYWVLQILDRANLVISRELFVRSCVIDLTARLDAYGILSSPESAPVLQTFKLFGDDLGTKNDKGQHMMQNFIRLSMSLPNDQAKVLQAMYEPRSRQDEVSEGIFNIYLEQLSDIDPSSAARTCPPHILQIASKIIEQYLLKTREQMVSEKKHQLEIELQKQGLNELTPEGRQQAREKLEEFNTGVTFDLSKREKRKLFWKGILTGVMIETSLVGLENETTFLRLAREYSLKGCILRQIPDKVKLPEEEVQRHVLSKAEGLDPAQLDPESMVTNNPSGNYSFDSSASLREIRDSLTQQPYSSEHGQIDQRFLNFVLGQRFCADYSIDTDLFPYLHQVAPLVLLDMSFWTHPTSLFDLTDHKEPQILTKNSKYTVSPAEHEKIEMFNFMMDELIKKDKAYAYHDKEYKALPISQDEQVVVPLLSPQDSLLNPKRYGLTNTHSQLEYLGSRIPQCYKDTYGAYARVVFLFDMIILRNYVEIKRLKSTLDDLGTKNVRDMNIPISSNYYGNYSRVLDEDVLKIIKREEDLTNMYRLQGLAYRKGFTDKSFSEMAQLSLVDAREKNTDQMINEKISKDFIDRTGSTDSKTGSKAKDIHSVTVDAELFRELQVKPNTLVQFTGADVMQHKTELDRKQRAQQWVDNGSL